MAEMTTASIDDLPDSDFAYIEPGGKVVDGKTEPRSLRHFPIHDAAHVRNALARLSQSPFGDKARAKVEAAAKKLGIGEPAGKSFFDMKAGLLTERKTKLWLDGEIGRRVLVIPFGGPIPKAGLPNGVDLDDEFFDEDTDLVDGHDALKASQWRLMDWHHDDDHVPSRYQGGPALSMKGLVIGEIELEDDPDEFGHWASWWIKRGKANQQELGAKRVAALQEMGQPIWGSSLAAYKKKADNGHIDAWPLIRHTASTSPRNHNAVIPPLKALLTDITFDDLSGGAMKALLEGYADQIELLLGSPDAAVTTPATVGEGSAKAGRVLSAKNRNDLRAAIDALTELLARGELLPPEALGEE
jgi:hypothetical protein